MKEHSVVSATKHPITIGSMCRDLAALGINQGDILLVHSSLSSIGWVCGGAQAVIEALTEVLGAKGTLVVPTHSSDISDPKEWENPPVPEEWIQTIYENMPAFEPDKTPSRAMGRIAELFRTYPGVVRSNHPLVSFAARGYRAEEIVREHCLTPQFGKNSPLGSMYECGAKVLLLGVGYDSCTCFHIAETLIEKMPTKRVGTAMFLEGKRVWKWFEDYDYDADDFVALGQDFETKAKITAGNIGNAQCKLFLLSDGVDFATSWLEQHRFSGK